jgi:flagellar hook protein FlgE
VVLPSDPTSPIQPDSTSQGDNSFMGYYRMYAYLNNEELLDIGKAQDPGEGSLTEPGPILIRFNPTNGLLREINGQTFTANAQVPAITIKGADPAYDLTKISLDLTGATQFASSSIVKASQQDGYTKGDLIGVTFSGAGEMIASFSNGQNQALGVVALATFENQAGLQPSGDTEWIATLDSGGAIVNPPGTGLNGTLRSAALEASNVDLSEELVKLIEGQRNYQANSKTLETMNAITQTILQI